MPASSHLLTLVASLLLTDRKLRFSHGGEKYFVLLALAHMANATFALWVSLSLLCLSFFSSASRSNNILSWNKFSAFHCYSTKIAIFVNDVRQIPTFHYSSNQPDFFLFSKLWKYLADQGSWYTSVDMTHSSPLGTSHSTQGAEICNLNLKDNTSVSMLTTHWVLEIICVSPILGLCLNSINIPSKSIRKIHRLHWMKMLHVSYKK